MSSNRVQRDKPYAHIWVAGEKRKNLKIDDFAASIDGNILVYRFAVALAPPADPAAGDIVVSLYDREIVVDFRFIKKNKAYPFASGHTRC